MLLALLLQLGVADVRDSATFKARIAAFDVRERQLAEARGTDPRGQAALAWLQSLAQVLASIPIERTDDPIFSSWLAAHDELVVYSAPAGEWLVRHEVLRKTHDEHRQSTAADEIAWLGAITGIPGECEGYVPCYMSGLNYREGEYLRRERSGRHRGEAMAEIAATISRVITDLLSRPERADYLKVPDDCPDLVASLDPLREAVGAGQGSAAAALREIERLRAYCPRR
jgi:hypothetical protein